MQSMVVPHGHYKAMRQKTLKEGLLKRHEQKLAGAGKVERKRILAEIDAEVEATVNGDLKKWSSSKSTTAITANIKINGFKATAFILTFLAVSIGALWLAGIRL